MASSPSSTINTGGDQVEASNGRAVSSVNKHAEKAAKEERQRQQVEEEEESTSSASLSGLYGSLATAGDAAAALKDEDDGDDEEDAANDKEEKDLRKFAMSTAQTPRHCNSNRRTKGGSGGDQDVEDEDHADEDTKQGPAAPATATATATTAATGGDATNEGTARGFKYNIRQQALPGGDDLSYPNPHLQQSHSWGMESYASSLRTASLLYGGGGGRPAGGGGGGGGGGPPLPPPSPYYPPGASFHDSGYDPPYPHHHPRNQHQYYEDPYYDYASNAGAGATDPYYRDPRAQIPLPSPPHLTHPPSRHNEHATNHHPRPVVLHDPRLRYEQLGYPHPTDMDYHRYGPSTMHHRHPPPPPPPPPPQVYRSGGGAAAHRHPPRTASTAGIDVRYSPVRIINGSELHEEYRHRGSAHQHYHPASAYAPPRGYDYSPYRGYDIASSPPPPPPHLLQHHLHHRYPSREEELSVTSLPSVPSLHLPTRERGGGGSGGVSDDRPTQGGEDQRQSLLVDRTKPNVTNNHRHHHSGTASSSLGGSTNYSGMHAVSSSYSNETSRNEDADKGKGHQHQAVKQSPGVVTNSGSSASVETMLLPSQPSHKSNDNEVHATTVMPRCQIQQIDRVDKDEMLQMSPNKSLLNKTLESPSQTGKAVATVASSLKTKSVVDSALPGDECGTAETQNITTSDDGDHGEEGEKRDSPGELRTAESNLSRTSSLSASPTEEHLDVVARRSSSGNNNDNVATIREDHDYAPPPVGLGMYHRGGGGILMHPNPPPPHHHLSPYHHPSHYGARPAHPPPHLQPSRLSYHPQSGGGVGDDDVPDGDNDPSPSASTISTKASLAVATTRSHRRASNDRGHHPPERFMKNYPPTPNIMSRRDDPNDLSLAAAQHGGEGDRGSGSYSPSPHRMMYAHQLLSLSSDNNTEQSQQKPMRPVLVNKSREGAHGSTGGGEEACVQGQAKRRRLSEDNIVDSPPLKGHSPSPPALAGRLMGESPAAASAGASSSHHSQQSLELCGLGALPSWETAGKPLCGWSVCSGNTFGGMESLKDGVLSSAFSFSESSLPNNKKRETSFGAEKEEDGPSPKSILSKSGEKRKIAPGTHVQFSSDHHGDEGLEISTSMGSESRKRSHGMVTTMPSASHQSMHHLHDEYYYGDNPPRQAMYPYDHYGSRHLPPPHPSHRHPLDQGYYVDEDPYYDHYYGPPPPHPPPYGYPHHSRHQPVSRHPHHRAEYAPPPLTSHPPLGPGRRRGTNIYTVHTPPTSTSRVSGGPSTMSLHHHPTISSQFTHVRNAPSAAIGGGGLSYGSWSKDDDNALMDLMRKIKSPKSWDPIAKKFERGKSAREIQDRWTRYLKPGSRKGQWTDEEDQVVIETVQNSMEDPFTRWSDLAQRLPGRVGKQVRDRWVNHLNPSINHLPFSREDDLLLWNGHNVAGKRWVEISSKYFKGARSENHIKNRWYSASFKKFIAKEFGPDSYRLANDSCGGGSTRDEAHYSMPVLEHSSYQTVSSNSQHQSSLKDVKLTPERE